MPTAKNKSLPDPSTPIDDRTSVVSLADKAEVTNRILRGCKKRRQYVAVLRGPGPLESVIFLEEEKFELYLEAVTAETTKKQTTTTRKRKRKGTKPTTTLTTTIDSSQCVQYDRFDQIQDAVAYLVSGGASGTPSSCSSSSSRSSSKNGPRGATATDATTPFGSGATDGRTPSSRPSRSELRRDCSTGGPSSTSSPAGSGSGCAAAVGGGSGGSGARLRTPAPAPSQRSARSRRSSRRTAGACAERLGDERRSEPGEEEAERKRPRVVDESTGQKSEAPAEERECQRSTEEEDESEATGITSETLGARLCRVNEEEDDRKCLAKRGESADEEPEETRALAQSAGPWSTMIERLALYGAEHGGSFEGMGASEDRRDAPLRRWLDWQRREYRTLSEGLRRGPMLAYGECDKFDLTGERIRLLREMKVPGFVDDGERVSLALDGDVYTEREKEDVEWELERRLAELEANLNDGSGRDAKDSDEEDRDDDGGNEDGNHEDENDDDDDEERKQWLIMYERLRRRRRESRGDGNAPEEKRGDDDEQDRDDTDEYDDDPDLSAWARDQRTTYRLVKEGRAGNGPALDRDGPYGLSVTRIKLLQAVDFNFGWEEGVSGKWGRMLERLKEWKAQSGTFDVDQDADRPLYDWTSAQHSAFKRIAEGEQAVTPATEARQKALRAVGFTFRHYSFEELLNRLKTFKREAGHCDVPAQGHAMSSWMRRTRTRAALMEAGKPTDGKLTAEQLERLREVGFRTRREATNDRIEGLFETRLEELKQYKQKNKDCLVPCKTKLGRWVADQRREYRALQAGKPSSMTLERMQTLLGLGFVFDLGKAKSCTWEERMETLRKYKSEHGDLLIPVGHPLRAFAGDVRKRYNRTLDGETTRCLSKEHIQDLEALGFVFQLGKRPKKKPLAIKSWDERFEELVEFKQIYGHVVVPQHYQGHPGLGGWVNKCRTDYTRIREGRKWQTLSPDRVARLVDLGFAFDAMYRRGCKLGDDLHELDRSSHLAVERSDCPPAPPLPAGRLPDAHDDYYE